MHLRKDFNAYCFYVQFSYVYASSISPITNFSSYNITVDLNYFFTLQILTRQINSATSEIFEEPHLSNLASCLGVLYTLIKLLPIQPILAYTHFVFY